MSLIWEKRDTSARREPVPCIDNIFVLVKYMQSGCNRNTYFQNSTTGMGALCKTGNSLYTDLFLNERGKL